MSSTIVAPVAQANDMMTQMTDDLSDGGDEEHEEEQAGPICHTEAVEDAIMNRKKMLETAKQIFFERYQKGLSFLDNLLYIHIRHQSLGLNLNQLYSQALMSLWYRI